MWTYTNKTSGTSPVEYNSKMGTGEVVVTPLEVNRGGQELSQMLFVGV